MSLGSSISSPSTPHSGPARPDVLIVGAGLAGTSLAWHLAGRTSVRILEQGQGVCGEASAQNAGMIRRLVDDPDERALAIRTHAFVQSLPPEDWSGPAPFRRTGSVIAVRDPASQRARRLSIAADGLRARGVLVEQLGPAEIAELAPPFQGSPINYGYWVEDEGTCDPIALGEGFARGARARGAQFDLDVRVTRLRRDGDRVIGVETTRGPIDAGAVVLASAAWTQHLLQGLPTDRRLAPLGRHLFQTTAHPAAHHRGAPDAPSPWCWIEDEEFYVRPHNGGFRVSPCDERPVHVDPGAGSKLSVDPEVQAQTAARLATLMPTLADARIEEGWIGMRTFAPHRRPLLGPDPQLPGLYYLTALGGSGLSTAFPLAERLARILTDRTDAPPSRMRVVGGQP